MYSRINAMGDRFRTEINQFAEERDYPATAVGLGSMFWMHTTRGPVNNIRDAHQGNPAASAGLRLLYRRNGLHISSNHGFISAAHTEEDITHLIGSHQAAMEELRAQAVW
jgi:glutamate-1-semialdehyde aminotransferase